MHAPDLNMSADPMKGDPLAGFITHYSNDTCYIPCTPHGCPGHVSDIPVAFSLGGMSFAVEYPDDVEEAAQANEADIDRVIEILQALSELIAKRPPWTPKVSPVPEAPKEIAKATPSLPFTWKFRDLSKENLKPPSEIIETQRDLPPPEIR